MPSLQLASRNVLLILITSICLDGNFLFSQSTEEIAKALSSIDPTVAKDKFQEVFKNQDWEDVRNQINGANAKSSAEWKSITTKEGWEKYSNLKLAQLKTSLGKFPEETTQLNYKVLKSIPRDGYTIECIAYESRSGGMPLIQISEQNPTGKAQSHFKNLKVVNWNDKSGARAVVNLGGGPRLKPEFPHGVDVYVHDWFGVGKTALVASTRTQDYKSNEKDFKKVSFFTGDESQAKEVKDVPFPQFPKLVDDLPPFSVITRIKKEGGKVLVEGVASENSTV